MKRILLIMTVLLAVPTFGRPSGDQIPKARIEAIISECRLYEGTDVVRLGRMATAAVKKVIRWSSDDDKETLALMEAARRVHGVSVLSFDDCSADTKSKIIKKLDGAFSKADVLMEIKDEGQNLKMFGIVDEKAGSVKDFVLYAPSDCSLICLFGTIPMDAVSTLIK